MLYSMYVSALFIEGEHKFEVQTEHYSFHKRRFVSVLKQTAWHGGFEH